MNKIIIPILVSFIILTLVGCNGRTYSFKKSVDEIKSIEIVSAKNSLEFTIIKTLSETEKNDFIERFQMIKFKNYFFGDPMSINGNALKITYINGDYEMICHYWAEYVMDGEIYFVRKSCDEEVFNELLEGFLE